MSHLHTSSGTELQPSVSVSNDRTGSPSQNAEDPPIVQVDSVRLGYKVDNKFVPAVDDVSFEIAHNEKVILLGPSGCGKSTLLKTIAGFISPESGSVKIRGETSFQPGPDRAVVFQEFDQLFPWRTVLGNVSYALRVNGMSKPASIEGAAEYLELTGLSRAADRYPHQLSGGMKQRVAIARALALQPDMLLMDEPFGSLDAQTRTGLQRELLRIAEIADVAILFVTHSIQEALLLGDTIILLSSPPSTIQQVVEVSEVKDPDSQEFVEVRRRLRSGLARGTSDEEGDDGFVE